MASKQRQQRIKAASALKKHALKKYKILETLKCAHNAVNTPFQAVTFTITLPYCGYYHAALATITFFFCCCWISHCRAFMYCHALWNRLLQTIGMILMSNFILLAELHMWEFQICRFCMAYESPASGLQSWRWILYGTDGCQIVNCHAVGTVLIATFVHINSSLLTIQLLRHDLQKPKPKTEPQEGLCWRETKSNWQSSERLLITTSALMWFSLPVSHTHDMLLSRQAGQDWGSFWVGFFT